MPVGAPPVCAHVPATPPRDRGASKPRDGITTRVGVNRKVRQAGLFA